MKRFLLAVFILCFLLCACSSNDPANSSADDPPGQNIQADAERAPEPPSDEETVSKEDVKQAVQSALEESFSAESYAVKVVSNRVEVTIATEYSIDEEPEGWADIRDVSQASYQAIEDAVLGFDGYSALLYLVDEQENILLSFMDGSCKFDTFAVSYEEEPEEEDNPPTISLAEFNQIENGMTYMEVYRIIGGMGEKLSETNIFHDDKYLTETYTWEGDSFLSSATVMFQGGKVISKSQYGLE